MNITDIITPKAERQTSIFDYTVEQVPLNDPEGNPTRYFGNRRTDTKEVLGVVSEKYEVLQNAQLFDEVETLFKSSGFSEFTRKTFVTANGARVRAVYDFPQHGFKMNNKNDIIFRLKVQNSFDRSLKASFQVGLFRLVCSNGLAAPVAAVGMTRKHTDGLDPHYVGEAFHRSVDAFSKAAPLLNAMSDFRLTQAQGHGILLGLQQRQLVRERMREAIGSIWDAPRRKEDEDRSLFNLYNAVTEHLTHDVEGKRFETAEKVNTAVLNTFTKALKHDTVLDLVAIEHN